MNKPEIFKEFICGFVDRQFVNVKLEQRAKFKKLRGGKGKKKKKK